MEKALYIAPFDYKDIGGLKYPIENYLKALSTKYDLDTIVVGYNKNAKDKQTVVDSFNSKEYSRVLVYGINQCVNCNNYLKEDKNWRRIKKFAHLQDCEYFYAKSVYEKTSWSKPKSKFLYYLKMLVYKRREQKVLSVYDDALYVSRVDAEYAQNTYRNINSMIHVIENGIEIPNRRNNSKRKSIDKIKIGFLSHMSPSIIDENIKPILTELLPALKTKEIEFQIIIAGKGMEHELKELCNSFEDVSYIGFVDDLADFYDLADIIISYTKKRNGILNKVLEAWAFEKCVVGISYNFEAFSKAKDGVHFISGTDKEEIAEQIKGLIRNPERILEIGENAGELTKTEYSWERKRKEYIECFYE